MIYEQNIPACMLLSVSILIGLGSLHTAGHFNFDKAFPFITSFSKAPILVFKSFISPPYSCVVSTKKLM
jgi:hypothetical protein